MPGWKGSWTEKCSYLQDGAPDAVWCPQNATGRDEYGRPACAEHGGPEEEDEESPLNQGDRKD